MLSRIRALLRSPQGRQLTDRGRAMARDPHTRRRARDLFARLRAGRRH